MPVSPASAERSPAGVCHTTGAAGSQIRQPLFCQSWRIRSLFILVDALISIDRSCILKEDLMNFLAVALGGAAGAMGRYAISLIPVKTEFPVLTLITNVIGAILIGFVVGIASDREDLSQNSLLFWKTGVCGGFTTFSTFSLEAMTLIENKSYFAGGCYMALSVGCCLIGILCGRKLALFFQG